LAGGASESCLLLSWARPAADWGGRKLGTASCCVLDLGWLPDFFLHTTGKSGAPGHKIARVGCCASMAERATDGQPRRGGLARQGARKGSEKGTKGNGHVSH
jgi:hypothetical protein